MAKTILAVVDDLFFLSKILQAAKLVGVTVEAVAPENLAKCAAQTPVHAVILDLNHRSGSALDVLRSIKADVKLGDAQIIGFLSHVQTDLAAAARGAGCNVVLARSTFTQRLPELLRELTAKP